MPSPLRARKARSTHRLQWVSKLVTLSCALLLGVLACNSVDGDGPSLSRNREQLRQLLPGQFFPAISEKQASGVLGEPISRNSEAFKRLVRGDPSQLVFKDEEGTGADLVMSPRLRDRLMRLADLVETEWPGSRVRITEAWDEQNEHGPGSLHYAGRAADITTTDPGNSRLSRLAGLAITAGFDWVYYEGSHVHVSVK